VRVFEVYDRELLVRKDEILELTPELVGDLQARLSALGHYKGDVTRNFDEDTRGALEAFAGEFNLEGRLRDDDRVSETLVRELRDITPEV
jgi:peptidoglycan hydrolase-like protein with peptidoglycan-binding domain